MDPGVSKTLWTVCSKFNKLPNDPLIADLEDFQLTWILTNMAQDAQAMSDAMKGKSSSDLHISSDDGITAADISKLRSLIHGTSIPGKPAGKRSRNR